MDLPDEIKQILKSILKHDHESGTWVQVASLKSEDRLKWRTYQLEDGKRKGELDAMKTHMELIIAQHNKAKEDIWQYFYKTYELPPDENYRILDGQTVHRRMESLEEGD